MVYPCIFTSTEGLFEKFSGMRCRVIEVLGRFAVINLESGHSISVLVSEVK